MYTHTYTHTHPTCVCSLVVLQVSSSGELLATVLLFADEGLLAVVSPHVNLQPLQNVETLPAAFGAAPEHPIVPGRGGAENKNVNCVDCGQSYLQIVALYVRIKLPY